MRRPSSRRALGMTGALQKSGRLGSVDQIIKETSARCCAVVESRESVVVETERNTVHDESCAFHEGRVLERLQGGGHELCRAQRSVGAYQFFRIGRRAVGNGNLRAAGLHEGNQNGPGRPAGANQHHLTVSD